MIAECVYGSRKNGLRLPKPKFILSIIGGTKNFKISEKGLETEKAFKNGLMKAAKISDTWIITDGIDIGAMKLVGDAISEETDSCNFTVLGITERKKIFGKYPEVRKKSDGIPLEKNAYLLNENNTSFIFIDNENNDESEFRTRFEAHILRTLNIPMFLFVINGDLNTLEVISRSLDQRLSIVIFAVSFNNFNSFRCLKFLSS